MSFYTTLKQEFSNCFRSFTFNITCNFIILKYKIFCIIQKPVAPLCRQQKSDLLFLSLQGMQLFVFIITGGLVRKVPLYKFRLFLSLFLQSSSTSRWDIRLRHSGKKKEGMRPRIERRVFA